MVQVRIVRIIDVPCERAWELVSDFVNIQNIHPMVKTVDQRSDQTKGLGAVRACNFYDGNQLVEEIVAWDETNHTFTIRMVDGSVPLKRAEGVISVEKIDDQTSKMVMDMGMSAKFGLLGKLMERFVFKPKFGSAIGDLFAGVQVYDKTGIPIGKDFKAKTPALVT